jgi:hypothetical protein
MFISTTPWEMRLETCRPSTGCWQTIYPKGFATHFYFTVLQQRAGFRTLIISFLTKLISTDIALSSSCFKGEMNTFIFRRQKVCFRFRAWTNLLFSTGKWG